MASSKQYLAWQKQHPNFITPEVLEYEILPNGYIVELSEGTGFDHEPYYGVTLLIHKDEKIAVAHGEQRNRSGKSRLAMENYYNELIEIVRKWRAI